MSRINNTKMSSDEEEYDRDELTGAPPPHNRSLDGLSLEQLRAELLRIQTELRRSQTRNAMQSEQIASLQQNGDALQQTLVVSTEVVRELVQHNAEVVLRAEERADAMSRLHLQLSERAEERSMQRFESLLVAFSSAAAVPGNVPVAALPAFNNNQTPVARQVASLPAQRPVVDQVTATTIPHGVGNVLPPSDLQPGDVIPSSFAMVVRSEQRMDELNRLAQERADAMNFELAEERAMQGFGNLLVARGAAAADPGNVPVAALPAFNNNIQPAAHAGRSVVTPAIARLPAQRPAVDQVTPATIPHGVRNDLPPPDLQPGDVISVNGCIEGETFVVTSVFARSSDGNIAEGWVQYTDHDGTTTKWKKRKNVTFVSRPNADE